MKIAVVCSPGIGDALILHVASHNLSRAGHDVTTVTPHHFGKWLSDYKFGESDYDAIFLQHDNSQKSKELHKLPLPVYTFYGSHQLSKHGPLRPGFDYVCDPNRTMVDNVLASLKLLFHIHPSPENGLKPPPGLVHRRYKNRVAIHTGSSDPNRNWHKFEAVAQELKRQGYDPAFLPLFPTLEDLASFLYESGYFVGNDSGPGHLAAYLKIPYVVIGKEARHLRLWRPGWGEGKIITPPAWLPRWKWVHRRWKRFITVKNVVATFYTIKCN